MIAISPGDIVKTCGWGWDREYADQHFIVTRVKWDSDHRKYNFLLQDHIGGGFIWASEDEIDRVDDK